MKIICCNFNKSTAGIIMSWPTESANQVQFQWTSSNISGAGRKASTTLCKLIYDDTHHYIRVVDSVTNHVLDTIDGYDILGANVAIEMNDAMSNAPRAITTSDAAPSDAAPTLNSKPNDTQAHATLSIYAYPRKPPKSLITSLYRTCQNTLSSTTSASSAVPTPTYVRPTSFVKYGARSAQHRTMIVQPMEDLFHVREVVKALQRLARNSPHTIASDTSEPLAAASAAATTTTTIRPPVPFDAKATTLMHYLIICNPKAGPNQNAEQIVKEHVIPMLQQANIETTVCLTTHPGHAVELCQLRTDPQSDVQSSPIANDTTTTAIPQKQILQRLESDITYFNGIVVMGGDGTMHEVLQGLQSRPDAKQVLTTIPIGIIGCGTANGLATSLSYTSYSYNKDTKSDGSSGKYDFTYLGVINDIFGIAKGYTIEADLSTYTILESKKSNTSGTTTKEEAKSIKQYTSFLTFTYGFIAEVDIESERIHWMGHVRFDVWAVVRLLFLRTYPIKLSYTTDIPSTNTSVPSVSEPVPATWVTTEDKIILFWASQVSHVSPLELIYLSQSSFFQMTDRLCPS
jgi:diacylglycerol kinase family enzyme